VIRENRNVNTIALAQAVQAVAVVVDKAMAFEAR